MEGGAVGHNIKRGPPKFALIWFSGFREDLNVIFYQNMPNLHIGIKRLKEKPGIYVKLLIAM